MRRFLIGAMAVIVGAWAGTRAQSTPAGFEFQVNTYTTGPQMLPSVSADAHGNFVVVWDSYGQDGSSGGIFGQRFDSSGAPVGGEFQINSVTAGNQVGPDVAMSGLGSFVVVWTSAGSDGDGFGIVGRRFSSSGVPLGGEFQVNTHTTGDQYYPSVASDAAGNFIVAWNDLGAGMKVRARRFDALGNARAGEFAVSTATTNYQLNPAVAADPPGNFVVTWQEAPPAAPFVSVAARRFNAAGAPITGDILVSAYTGSNELTPDVAVAVDGTFVVVWARTGSTDTSHGQRFSSTGAPFGSPFLVGDSATELAFEPRVAGDPLGNFVVSWSGVDGGGYGVAARLFNSAGLKRGPEFAVNSYTTGRQSSPAALMDTDGNFVVTWRSNGEDGSGYGIFAQRFACTDVDMDGTCDLQDVVVTSPLVSDTLDCSDPVNLRPTVQWDGGAFDKFRVLIAADAQFTTANRVTSGSTLLKTRLYTPPGKKWKKVCDRAVAINPLTPQIYVEVYGVDISVPKSAPNRTSFSQVVQVAVAP
ncbi:MAG TPA: hypothetical protein VE404_08420 [Verrucomicrobiae bacterium]|nr:hypothetical protein [Verrucomicrobiae bacterium]